MSRRTRTLLWALALVTIGVFCRLGLWQVDRMHQKQAMLDGVQRVLARRDARPLSMAADASRALDYDWAAGSGRFVDAPAVLLDNQSRDDRSGVRAYRLFQPDATAAPLLVELGWLPMPGDRRLPDIARPIGERRVEGLLAAPPAHGILAAIATPQANGTLLTTGLDAAELPKQLRQSTLAPRVLMLDPKDPLGYARSLDVLPNTLPPERHLGYAVQWFALAGAVFVTALVLTLRRPRKRAGSTSDLRP